MKRREIRRSKKNTGAPKWMVTYSDMVTLILVFFILLFSMSQIDKAKFEAIAESFRNRAVFDYYPSPIPMEHPSENPQNVKDEALEDLKSLREAEKERKRRMHQEEMLDKLMADVQAYLEENKLTDVISANRTGRGVELILQERIIFESGEAEILSSGQPFLDKIGKMLAKVPNYVRVEGHTDNRPISNYRYPSNWELSGARAGSVIRYMIKTDKLNENRFSAVGYGDTRPLVPNNSPKNWAKNRRVEIVILEENQEQQTQR